MTNHVVRLYAATLALLVFFVLWAAIAAHPWRESADLAPAALDQHERRLRADAALVRWLVQRRLAAGSGSTAQAPSRAAPSVRVVTLPPATMTRSS